MAGGFNHFAKDCVNKEACGKCAGEHKIDKCMNDYRKCVNCEEKIRKMKVVNLKSDHSAYDNNCPCLKRKIELYKSRIISSL